MQLLESALHENQLRITKFEEAIGVKDQVSFNPKKTHLHTLITLFTLLFYQIEP